MHTNILDKKFKKNILKGNPDSANNIKKPHVLDNYIGTFIRKQKGIDINTLKKNFFFKFLNHYTLAENGNYNVSTRRKRWRRSPGDDNNLIFVRAYNGINCANISFYYILSKSKHALDHDW